MFNGGERVWAVSEWYDGLFCDQVAIYRKREIFEVPLENHEPGCVLGDDQHTYEVTIENPTSVDISTTNSARSPEYGSTE